MNVLVVDDDPDMRFLFRIWIEGHGWRLEEASSGEEALRMVKPADPDVLIIDYMMPPGLNGLETAQALRGQGYTRPILICSAHVTGTLQQDAADLQADVYDKSELDALVDRLVTIGESRG